MQELIKDITTPAGQCGRVGTDTTADSDIARGVMVARALGSVDVGQAVVVQQGETLWQIAQRIAPEADPRATVTAIRELNGLGGAPVVAGQTVIVPLGH